ncbi:MAG TPA: PAS domain S-box protein, partial [Methanomicrobiales archaeon]|nr:PAS domain S-box protein [Methanomicrobiales archaeon]
TAEREGGYRMPVEVYAREFCHPDDMHLVADEVRKSIEATDPGYTSQIEHRIIRRDGEIRNIVVRIAITKDEQGRTVKTHGVNQDITERKRAEEALRESEAQLNAVVQGSPVPQFGIDRDHRIIYWNRALEELTGIPGKDVIGTSGQWRPFYPTERWVLADYLVEGEPEKIREAYGGTCRPSGLIDGAFEAIDFFPTLHTEGGWLYYTAAPIRDANGAVIGAVETLEDITERKQAENALRESEERYKGVIESQTEFITRFTPDARVTFANDAYLRYFGLERAEIIGKKFHPRIPAEDREEVREHFASLTRESPVGTVEHRIIMPDGQVKWQKWVDRAIFGADGELVEYQSVGRDITGQKEAEEALRLSESRYREFFTTSRDVVFITTPAGEWVDFNDAAVELFGYNSRDELKSTPIARLYEDAEKRNAFIDLIIGKGYVKEYPVKLRKRDGTLIDTLITAVPLKGENGSITSLVGSIRDITERKKVEEALQESEEKYRNLVELASTGIAIIQDGSIAYANKGLGEVWGGSPEELLQKPISHLVHPKEREKILDRYRRRIAGETMPSVYETVFLRKDGSAYPAEIHAGLITYRGRPADLILIQDITERKRFVRALQESQERYRQIVEGTNAGVWVFDNDFTTIYANEQMARMLGVLPGEMLGRSISDFVFPDDRAQVNEVFAKIGNGRIPDTELRFRRKDQRESWLRVAAGPFFDVEGQRVGFTGIFSDITTSRKAEAAVRQAEAKYHSIVEFAVEGIYQIDTKGRFLTANPAMARVLGYESVEEMLASVTDTANQLWVSPAQRRQYLTKLREEELVNGFEAEYFRKDGGRIWVSLSTRAVKGPDGKIAYSEGTLEDITQRKRAEDALRESEEMFRNPVEQSPVGIFLIQDGIVRYVNPMLAEMGGFSRDDIMARPFADFVHPEDQAKVGEAIARLLRHEAHSESVQYRSRKRDGGYLEMEAYGSSMIFQGRPAVYGTIID